MVQRPSLSEGLIAPRKEPKGDRPVNFQTKEIRQSQKKSFFKRFFKSCIILLIIILVLLVLGITYVAAASGLVNIPGLSSVLYKIPQPIRRVAAEDLDTEGIKSRVQKEVSKGNDRVEVFITEGNLTSIMNTTTREGQKLEDAQVTIFDNGERMEVFGKMVNSNIYLSAIYNIGKDFEGNFKIESINKFKVGNIKVPSFLMATGIFTEDSIKNLTTCAIIEDALSNDGTGLEILDIDFSEGKIIEFVSLKEDNNIEGNLGGEETSFDKEEQATEVN